TEREAALTLHHAPPHAERHGGDAVLGLERRGGVVVVGPRDAREVRGEAGPRGAPPPPVASRPPSSPPGAGRACYGGSPSSGSGRSRRTRAAPRPRAASAVRA